MPNRILREGILTSDRVDALDLGAELFYRRLMSVVDDFGRFDARPVMLKSHCFPLRVDRVREADISRWMASCQKAGLLALYAVNGKQYLELADFKQQRRIVRSKYPAPENGEQMHSECVADNEHPPSICAPESRSEKRVTSNEKKTKARSAALPLPDWLDSETWNHYVEMRKALRRPLTDHACRLAFAKLDKLRADGHDPQTVLEESILNGWQGLFPPRVNGVASAAQPIVEKWWTSEAATKEKAKELGLSPRGGEAWMDFRGRIWEAINARQTHH